VTLSDEDLGKFKDILSELDENEDVQNVYHNVENA
jgi:transcriptional/translational regulatory protein YebC/TACO1